MTTTCAKPNRGHAQSDRENEKIVTHTRVDYRENEKIVTHTRADNEVLTLNIKKFIFSVCVCVTHTRADNEVLTLNIKKFIFSMCVCVCVCVCVILHRC